MRKLCVRWCSGRAAEHVLADGERRKLVRDALRISLWRATRCSGLWRDLECCSIPVVDGPAARSG